MDIEQLLGELEGLAHKVHVPGFQDLIQTVRNIYEKTVEYITPHEPISDASRTLTALHSELNSLCTQLETSLPDFQTVYTGAGSDTYHASAAFALQGMQQQRDALAHAAQQHQTMAEQFALARDMQIALIVMLGAVTVTLIALVASAGADAPITVPLAIGETVGAAAIITTLTEALVAAGIAVDALLAFLATEEGLALFAATAIVITGLTHPHLLSVSQTGVNLGKLFSKMKTTSDGRRIRVRKLSPKEVSKLQAEWGQSFHRAKKGYKATDEIYEDENGEYWIGRPGSDNVVEFP